MIQKTLQRKYRLISITRLISYLSLVIDNTSICFWYALISLLSIFLNKYLYHDNEIVCVFAGCNFTDVKNVSHKGTFTKDWCKDHVLTGTGKVYIGNMHEFSLQYMVPKWSKRLSFNPTAWRWNVQTQAWPIFFSLIFFLFFVIFHANSKICINMQNLI